MQDVARAAGVSQTAVSFVVNNVSHAGIPIETRQRILAAIEKLGYHPNVFAKNLRKEQSDIIGLITDEIAASPHAGQLIQGAQNAAVMSGNILLLANTGGDPEVEQVMLETMLAYRVHSVIYATMDHQIVQPPAALREIATVLLNCSCTDQSWPSVVPDEASSARSAVNSCLQKNHRRIGLINSGNGGPAAKGRLEGYQQALVADRMALHEDWICVEERTMEGGYQGAMRLMLQPLPPTAIVCFNVHIALVVYVALNDLKLRIPQDVALIGFENIEGIAAFLRPKLSTMALPYYAMGAWAVNYLLKHGECKEPLPPIQHTIECAYIERDSV